MARQPLAFRTSRKMIFYVCGPHKKNLIFFDIRNFNGFLT